MAITRLRVAVLGAGRMGQQVVQVLEQSDDCRIAGVWARHGGVVLDELLDVADVAIDFTLPDATAEIVAASLSHEKPLVCGVTGLDEAGIGMLNAAATNIPLFYDRNMSLGIAVMTRLVHQASTALGEGFSSKIRETHHIHKKDAPSGTAVLLREALIDKSAVIVSERVGEVVGDHTVLFTGPGESLEIAHHVADRGVFAHGAVNAARWLIDRPPGLYRMADMITEIKSGQGSS